MTAEQKCAWGALGQSLPSQQSSAPHMATAAMREESSTMCTLAHLHLPPWILPVRVSWIGVTASNRTNEAQVVLEATD